MADREKLIELLKDSPSLDAVDDDGYAMGADHLIANGVTFATDNHVGGKLSPTANSSSEVAKILDVYIPCQTCGKLIPAGGNNHCLTCRLWLLRLEETMQKWIPVTERLPELHGDFITAIAFEDGDILIDISVWYGKCWETLSGEKCNVTHWMPLPEPPKEVE